MMNKTALITGASSGIGFSTAILLKKNGCKVYAIARQQDKLKRLEAEGISTICIDITDNEKLTSAVNAILSSEGSIDILVNNAGYGSFGALEDVPLTEAKYQFDVNLFSMARLIQLVLPAMRKNRYGKIVNLSSVGGKGCQPHGSWYHASKFAIEGLSDCLRMELKQFDIDVIVIEPGAIKTEWYKIAREHLLQASSGTAYEPLAVKHAGMLKKVEQGATDPEEVARTILRSVLARRPKTRYPVGGGARLILLCRRLFSDRVIDKMVLRQIH